MSDIKPYSSLFMIITYLARSFFTGPFTRFCYINASLKVSGEFELA